MADVLGKKIDSYALRNSIVQGETGSDTIRLNLDDDKDWTGYAFVVRGTINGGSVQSDAMTPQYTSFNEPYIDWTVESTFTSQSGMLYLTLVGTKDGGDVITKAIGSVEVLPDMAMQSSGEITQSLFERLVAQVQARKEDAEAYATGKRNGQDVPATDPAYHNNAAYYAAQAAGGGDYTNLSNKPSIGGVTLLGNKTLGDLGAIADPSVKSSGQYLKWDGSAWVAASGGGGGGAVDSVNGMTGDVVINKSLTATIPATGWTQDGSLYKQTISVSGVTTTATLNIAPDPDDFDVWATAKMRGYAQAAGSITFACETVPTEGTTANILLTEAVQ